MPDAQMPDARRMYAGGSPAARRRKREGNEKREYTKNEIRAILFQMERRPRSKPEQNTPKRSHSRHLVWLLIVMNVIDILVVTLLCFWQGRKEFLRSKEEAEASFLSMVESFSLFSGGDMMGQQMSVVNWTRYIEQNGLDLNQTLIFLSNVSSASNIHLHLIRASDLRGYCADVRHQNMEEQPATSGGHPAQLGVPVYRELDYRSEASAFASVLPSIISPPERVTEILLTPMFSSEGSGERRLAFCGPVMIREKEGRTRYIILKLISAEELASMWKLPDSYRMADLMLLDRHGEYLLRGRTGGSVSNFWDYIRTEYGLSYYDIGKIQGRFVRPGANLAELKTRDGRTVYYAGCATGLAGNQTFVVSLRQEDIIRSSVNYRLAVIVLAGMLCVFFLDGSFLFHTNRKLRESAERAEKESKFKTEFLSSMSHDIRTPMNAIMGLSKIMRHCWGDEAKMLDCLGKVEVSGRHLLMLINDVLDISKIESEGVVLSPATFSLNSLVDEIQTLNETQSREKGITMAVRKEGIDRDLLVADELRLKQIFMNLLSNAIKYTPEGGRVDVAVTESSSPSANLRQVRYVVRDTGLGMSEDFMKTMYQAFSREVDTRVNKIPGTGLGLAIVKQLVDMMGGRIDCQSMIGKGTTFTVDLDLPVAQVTGGKEDEKEDWKEDFIKGATLLVAEDNDINWEIEKELLSYKGIECERAEDGKICVEKLEAAPNGTYAAILMDMQMPVMDGMTATKAIRALKDPGKSGIPIVAVTANAFVDDVRACLAAGMDAHVCKPVSVESVIKALRSVMRRK